MILKDTYYVKGRGAPLIVLIVSMLFLFYLVPLWENLFNSNFSDEVSAKKIIYLFVLIFLVFSFAESVFLLIRGKVSGLEKKDLCSSFIPVFLALLFSISFISIPFLLKFNPSQILVIVVCLIITLIFLYNLNLNTRGITSSFVHLLIFLIFVPLLTFGSCLLFSGGKLTDTFSFFLFGFFVIFKFLSPFVIMFGVFAEVKKKR